MSWAGPVGPGLVGVPSRDEPLRSDGGSTQGAHVVCVESRFRHRGEDGGLGSSGIREPSETVVPTPVSVPN